jgi:hypothetical protein
VEEEVLGFLADEALLDEVDEVEDEEVGKFLIKSLDFTYTYE